MYDVKLLGRSDVGCRSTTVAANAARVAVTLWSAPHARAGDPEREAAMARRLVQWADRAYGRSMSHQAFSVLVSRVIGNPQHLTGKLVGVPRACSVSLSAAC